MHESANYIITWRLITRNSQEGQSAPDYPEQVRKGQSGLITRNK